MSWLRRALRWYLDSPPELTPRPRNLVDEELAERQRVRARELRRRGSNVVALRGRVVGGRT